MEQIRIEKLAIAVRKPLPANHTDNADEEASFTSLRISHLVEPTIAFKKITSRESRGLRE